MKEFTEALKAHITRRIDPDGHGYARPICECIDAFVASWRPVPTYAPSFDEAEFAELTRKGREAWAGVGSASEWVDEQRGGHDEVERLRADAPRLRETSRIK